MGVPCGDTSRYSSSTLCSDTSPSSWQTSYSLLSDFLLVPLPDGNSILHNKSHTKPLTDLPWRQFLLTSHQDFKDAVKLNPEERRTLLSSHKKLSHWIFRLQWYGKPHAAVDLQLEAVYGLPEVREHTILSSSLSSPNTRLLLEQVKHHGQHWFLATDLQTKYERR